MVERSFKYLDEIELSLVRGIGEKKFASLKKSKLKTVADLIRYFPKTHWDRSKIKLISEIDKNDETNEITIIGTIDKVSVFTTKTRLRIATLTIYDESGVLKAKWFGPQYIESRFKEGEVVAVSGKPEVKKNGSADFKNPEIEKFTDIDELKITGSFIPRYKKVDGMTNAGIRDGIKNIFEILDKSTDQFSPGLFDILPPDIRDEYSLQGRLESLKNIHFPKNDIDLKNAKNVLNDAIEDKDQLRITVENGAAKIPSFINDLNKNGIIVSSVSASKPTLDDVFLEVTGYRLEGSAGTDSSNELEVK